MGKYLGYVVVVNYGSSVFYNFQLSHEIKGNSFFTLTHEDRNDLLPDSFRKEINLYFDYRSEAAQEIMATYYQEDAFYVIDFELDQLEPNYKTDSERNPTGYKLSGIDSVENGQIHSLEDAGFYMVVEEPRVQEMFSLLPMVQVPALMGEEHMKYWHYHVMVQLSDGFYTGPYEVRRREQDGLLYIRPELEEQKYMVWGYVDTSVNLISVTTYYSHRHNESLSIRLLSKNQVANMEYRDLMTEQRLLDCFKEGIEQYGNGKIELRNWKSVFHQYEHSMLSGVELPESVRENRLAYLEDLFGSQQKVGDVLQRITCTITDLLENQKENSEISSFFQQLGQQNIGSLMVHQEQSKERISQLVDENKEQQEEIRVLKQQLKETQDKKIEVTKKTLDEKLRATSQEYSKMKKNLAEMQKELDLSGGMEELQERRDSLAMTLNSLEFQKGQLEIQNENIQQNIESMIEESKENMAGIAFNGFVSNQLVSAAARWEAEQNEVDYENCLDVLGTLASKEMDFEDFPAYLVKTVGLARPDYDENTILNIAICMSQGFLTVFSGEPGCGKTSMCHIMAQALGLTGISALASDSYEGACDLNRYVQISVERGWTSKRDFIGYFNPLSKNFDKTNSKMYDALKLLDLEKERNQSHFPMLVLLDEANLSPMEYYWADFMNVCDDLDENSGINLGEENYFSIPETLHFLATINNDHTTEMLSPRLIDRSWVIKLPSNSGVSSFYLEGKGGFGGNQRTIPTEELRLVPWETVKKAFVPSTLDLSTFSEKGAEVLEQLRGMFQTMRLAISPRTELAMMRYLGVATRFMTRGSLGEEVSLVALDFAVAQRLLPKIVGSGEEFRSELVHLSDFCKENELGHCAKVLDDMIRQGDKQMKYYQFF